MRNFYSLLLSASLLLSIPEASAVTPPSIVELQTNLGTIMVKLDHVRAPITAKNFIAYVNNGFYKNTVFHRVIKDFMVQGGGVNKSTLQFKTPSFAPITLESNNGLKNLKGTIAMARTPTLDSATSQFFINLVDNAFLDYTPTNPGYAVFGNVVKGMGIVTAIGNSLKSSSLDSGVKVPFALPFTSNYELVYIDAVYSSANLDATTSKTRITLSGPGSVTSIPSGINCGTSCVLSKPASGTVALTAKPATGFAFGGWRGDCKGYNPAITLDAAKGNHNCTAVFTKAVPAIQ